MTSIYDIDESRCKEFNCKIAKTPREVTEDNDIIITGLYTLRVKAVAWYYLGTFSSLYYKHMTIVNDDSRAINKLEALLTDDARGVIYDRRMF